MEQKFTVSGAKKNHLRAKEINIYFFTADTLLLNGIRYLFIFKHFGIFKTYIIILLWKISFKIKLHTKQRRKTI